MCSRLVDNAGADRMYKRERRCKGEERICMRRSSWKEKMVEKGRDMIYVCDEL